MGLVSLGGRRYTAPYGAYNCMKLSISAGFFQAGGLISVLSTDGVDLDNLYPPSKGDSLKSSRVIFSSLSDQTTNSV